MAHITQHTNGITLPNNMAQRVINVHVTKHGLEVIPSINNGSILPVYLDLALAAHRLVDGAHCVHILADDMALLLDYLAAHEVVSFGHA